MKISIGADHRGFNLKESLKNYFDKNTKEIFGDNFLVEWQDVGAFDLERSDYPNFAKKVCENVLSKKSDFGVLICGSGVGMSIAANRFKKIYAALCWNANIANLVVKHDGANVLILPSDFISEEDALNIVKILIASWNKQEAMEDRYKSRLQAIDEWKLCE